MMETLELFPSRDLPDAILDMYDKWFQRILNDLDVQPDSYYKMENDDFLKDLAICSRRAIPAGGAWIAQFEGVNLSLMKKGGGKQFFEFLLFLFFKISGLYPYYALHTSTRHLEDFNEAQRDNCYLNIAELLKLNPHIKGLVGESWFNDPALKHISPRLTYLRDRPVNNGARTFYCGTTQLDIEQATGKSKTRARLYKEGKYIPACYIVIWPRRELIKWSEHYSDKVDHR